MLVIRAGATGVQVASIFGAFGSQVTLFQASARILMSEDGDVAAAMSRTLQASGLRVLEDAGTIDRFEKLPAGVRLIYSKSGARKHLDSTMVVAAIGWVANTDGLDLDAAGVQSDSRGFIQVDSRLRTSTPNIFAAGDVSTDDDRDEAYAQANRSDADRRHAGDEPVRDRCLAGICAAHQQPASHGSGPGFLWNHDLRTGNPTGPAGQLDFWNYTRLRAPRSLITHLESRRRTSRRSGAQEGERRRLYPGRARRQAAPSDRRSDDVAEPGVLGRGRGRSCTGRRRQQSCRTGHGDGLCTFVAGSLSLQGTLRLTSTGITCPPDAPSGAIECRARTGSGSIPGLGGVSESVPLVLRGWSPSCPSSLVKPLATTGRFVVAGKGEINFALAQGARCVDVEPVRNEPQDFTITSGTGSYQGATGSGNVQACR